MKNSNSHLPITPFTMRLTVDIRLSSRFSCSVLFLSKKLLILSMLSRAILKRGKLNLDSPKDKRGKLKCDILCNYLLTFKTK